MEAVSFVVGGVLLAFAVGFLWGKSSADMAWVASAREWTPCFRTAHHCRGKFYYVIPEPEFCTKFISRAVLEASEGQE